MIFLKVFFCIVLNYNFVNSGAVEGASLFFATVMLILSFGFPAFLGY